MSGASWKPRYDVVMSWVSAPILAYVKQITHSPTNIQTSLYEQRGKNSVLGDHVDELLDKVLYLINCLRKRRKCLDIKYNLTIKLITHIYTKQ